METVDHVREFVLDAIAEDVALHCPEDGAREPRIRTTIMWETDSVTTEFVCKVLEATLRS